MARIEPAVGEIWFAELGMIEKSRSGCPLRQVMSTQLWTPLFDVLVQLIADD
jgi:hypothetical protein